MKLTANLPSGIAFVKVTEIPSSRKRRKNSQIHGRIYKEHLHFLPVNLGNASLIQIETACIRKGPYLLFYRKRCDRLKKGLLKYLYSVPLDNRKKLRYAILV